jgi:hypothetical protein
MKEGVKEGGREGREKGRKEGRRKEEGIKGLFFPCRIGNDRDLRLVLRGLLLVLLFSFCVGG